MVILPFLSIHRSYILSKKIRCVSPDITDISPKTIKATDTQNPISLNFTTSPRFKQLEKLNKAQQKRDARRKRNLNQLGK